jgi:hypothetical protein
MRSATGRSVDGVGSLTELLDGFTVSEHCKFDMRNMQIFVSAPFACLVVHLSALCRTILLGVLTRSMSYASNVL